MTFNTQLKTVHRLELHEVRSCISLPGSKDCFINVQKKSFLPIDLTLVKNCCMVLLCQLAASQLSLIYDQMEECTFCSPNPC